MPEPLSTLGLVLIGYAAMQPLTRTGTAVSAEAMAVRYAARDVALYAERSQSLFGTKAVAISEVRKLADACAVGNWDGNEALAINDLAVSRATEFIRALPGGFPMPVLAPEPDGSISLDWIQSRHRLFSLSIGRSERLAYAWLDGTNKGHAVERFDGLNVPQRILDLIQNHCETWKHFHPGCLSRWPKTRTWPDSLFKATSTMPCWLSRRRFCRVPRTVKPRFSRHGAEPSSRLWEIGRVAAGGRTLYGAAIIRARDVASAQLTVAADEPPPRHAVIRDWPWNQADPELQKAQQKEKASVLASAAGKPILR